MISKLGSILQVILSPLIMLLALIMIGGMVLMRILDKEEVKDSFKSGY